MLASFPSLHCSWRTKPVSRREAEGLVTELSSPRFVRYNTVIVSKIWITGYWLRSQLWHVTDANQWTVVEIEFLAKVGWKRGCQPFSCPCSQNVMHCRKRFCSTCLLQESMPFGKSKPPLPTRSLRSLRAAVRSTSSALCLHHAHPFVAAEEKRSVSCREAGGLVTELWSPRIVTIYWLCSYVTAAN